MKPRRGKSGGSVVAAGAGGVVTSLPQMSPHVTRSLRVRTTHRPPHVRVGVSSLASSIVCSQSDHTEPPLSLIAAHRTKIARPFRSAASPPHPLTCGTLLSRGYTFVRPAWLCQTPSRLCKQAPKLRQHKTLRRSWEKKNIRQFPINLHLPVPLLPVSLSHVLFAKLPTRRPMNHRTNQIKNSFTPFKTVKELQRIIIFIIQNFSARLFVWVRERVLKLIYY